MPTRHPPTQSTSFGRALVRLTGGLLLLAGLATPALRAGAQAGIVILSVAPPTYEFGQTITFEMEAQSGVTIGSLALFIQAPDGSELQWTDVAFVRGTSVTATATIDLAQQTLVPFAELTYWWAAEDVSHQRATSAPTTFYYEDNRFDWQRVGSGNLKVHWYSGTETFGQSALEVAAGALARINQDIRAPLPPHLDIYIYAAAADAQAALQRVGRSWANGHADPELGVIVVVVPDDLRTAVTLQREIPHEMTHVLIYKATGDQFPTVPLWLNEGLAVMNQGERDSTYPALLAAARDARAFLPLASLCGTFPTESRGALLAYAQSESVVRYLRTRFGSEGMYQLLRAYARGATCEAGLENSVGLSLLELEADWLREAIYTEAAPSDLPALAPWLVLTGLVLLAPLSLFVVTFTARRPRPPKAA